MKLFYCYWKSQFSVKTIGLSHISKKFSQILIYLENADVSIEIAKFKPLEIMIPETEGSWSFVS